MGLSGSPEPASLLVIQIGKLANGRFVAKADCHDQVVSFCNDHKLDAIATTKLVEAMATREAAFDSNIDQDLQDLGSHLSAVSNPSKVVYMRLKDIREGRKLGIHTFHAFCMST